MGRCDPKWIRLNSDFVKGIIDKVCRSWSLNTKFQKSQKDEPNLLTVGISRKHYNKQFCLVVKPTKRDGGACNLEEEREVVEV